jgi:hypothetical protein
MRMRQHKGVTRVIAITGGRVCFSDALYSSINTVDVWWRNGTSTPVHGEKEHGKERSSVVFRLVPSYC